MHLQQRVLQSFFILFCFHFQLVRQIFLMSPLKRLCRIHPGSFQMFGNTEVVDPTQALNDVLHACHISAYYPNFWYINPKAISDRIRSSEAKKLMLSHQGSSLSKPKNKGKEGVRLA
mmetsp:Transcript_6244/g.17612  ORF Transcript_6244/g.17612 Transcript_6244/m.17612 type:complete len:117 (-) Transcript_6244:521-871(-)